MENHDRKLQFDDVLIGPKSDVDPTCWLIVLREVLEQRVNPISPTRPVG